MSLDENKAGAAAVDPADFNTIVDAVVTLQAGGGGGDSLPDGWVANDPAPGVMNTAGGSLRMATGSIDTEGGQIATTSGGIDTGGGGIDTAGGEIDSGGGNVRLGESDYLAFETDHIAFNINNPITLTNGITLDQYPITGFDQLIPDTPPQVPAVPDAQDIVDALVTLGLVTQAAP